MPSLFGREIDAIVFDKDGVLLDFHARWRAVVEARLAALARRVPGWEARHAADALAAFGLEPCTRRILPDGLLATGTRAEAETLAAGLLRAWGHAAWPACRDAARAAFAEADAAVSPATSEQAIPEALAAVRRLYAAGFKLAVATTDRQAAAEGFLRRAGVADCFDRLVGADSGPAVKPAPDALRAIAAGLGIAPERLAMVGDLPVDLRMAHAAGAGLALGVTTGLGSREALLAAGAHAVLPSLAALYSK